MDTKPQASARYTLDALNAGVDSTIVILDRGKTVQSWAEKRHLIDCANSAPKLKADRDALLEALKVLLIHTHNGHVFTDNTTVDKCQRPLCRHARAAIAQAEETP